MPLCPEDRVVLTDMDIVRVRIERQFFLLRNPGEILGFGCSGQPGILQVFLSFLERAAGEVAGHDVIRGSGLSQIERDRREHA